MRRLFSPRSAPIVLSACALALERGQPLPETLERMAVHEPDLRPWLPRLLPALRGGNGLVELLHNWRVIDRRERLLLSRAEQAGLLASLLPVIATQQRQHEQGLVLWSWFPTWITLALVSGSVLLHRTLEWLTGNPFRDLYNSLAVTLPPMSTIAFLVPDFYALAIALSPPLLVFTLQLILRRIPDKAHLGPLRGFAVERARLACELCHWGRIGEQLQHLGQPLPKQWWQDAWAGYFWAQRHSFALSRKQVTAIQNCDPDDLTAQLHAIGLVQHNGPKQTLDWTAAYQSSLASLEDALARTRPYLWAMILVATIASFTETFFQPLRSIFGYLV